MMPSPAQPNPAPTTLAPMVPTSLPLRDVSLRATTSGAIAEVLLEQRFVNESPLPMHVTYVLPLPADSAVSGFSFSIGERTIVGEVDRRKQARERFEQAIASGQTAALLEEETSSLFTQELGNIPPGQEIVARISLDQRLRFLDDGHWEWRFPLAAAPRYLGVRDPSVGSGGGNLAVDELLPVRATLAFRIGEPLPDGRSPESPSHAVQVTNVSGTYEVHFGGGGRASLDRDVVIRWDARASEPRASVVVTPKSAGHDDAYALVTFVPPSAPLAEGAVARDLTVLLDTSGSMSGEPLAQAVRVASSLVQSLGDADTFELIEFSMSSCAFRSGPVHATSEYRAAAVAWLRALRASGGTEMRDGILAALRTTRPTSQKQVVLVTDGLIGFEAEIVREVAEKLPSRCRVHTVGVGSSVNRSLTQPVARAGRGVEIVCGLGEDVEPLLTRLLARTTAPLVTEVSIDGSAVLDCASAKPLDLFAGAPATYAVRVRDTGGQIVLSGTTATGRFQTVLEVPCADGQPARSAIRALYARERVEDLEVLTASGGGGAVVDSEIERLGCVYQIATRLTSWVAIDTVATVDPRTPSHRMVVPQALPFGMSAEGLGLRRGFSAKSAPQVVASVSYAAPSFQAGFGAPAPSSIGYGAPPPAPSASADADFEEASVTRSGRTDRSTGAPSAPAAPTPKRGREAAPSPTKKAAPARGLLARVWSALSGEEESADGPMRPAAEASPSPLQPTVSSPSPVDGAIRLAGRVVHAGEGAWGVELTLPAELEWDPADVSVVLETGETLSASVVGDRTTAPGSYRAGTVLRLILRVVGRVQGPLEVRVGSRTPLVIALGSAR